MLSALLALSLVSAMPTIQVARGGQGFVTSSGQAFRPWGLNYDRDYHNRLLEDYWATDWPTVEQDMRAMRRLGANVVRIHLQFGRFMRGIETPDEAALARLGQLLRVAEVNGLYLDLTGLACYRRADVPAWYAALDEAGRWSAQACFWSAVARACAASPAVFCYDLMNEPIVAGKARAPGDWLTGDLGGFTYCQYITLDPAGRATPDIARTWIRRMTAAIRHEDPNRLITVGLLPNAALVGFPPKLVATDLGFVATHIYPQAGHLDDDLRLLETFRVGKPLVIEETFPLGCSADQLRSFMADAGQRVQGWIGFYWGQSPASLRAKDDIPSALTLAWLELFAAGPPWTPDRSAREATLR